MLRLWAYLLVSAAVCTALSYRVAARRGADARRWALYGLVLGVLGVVGAYAFAGRGQRARGPAQQSSPVSGDVG